MSKTHRLDTVQKWLEEKGLDGVLLRTRANFSWLTRGGDNHIVNTRELGVADILLLRDGEKYVITSKSEARRIEEEEGMQDYTFIVTEWYEDANEEWKKLCEGKRIGADVSVEGLENVSADFAALRYVLDEEDLKKYRWLCYEAAHALESVCRRVRPGMTEFEIAGMLSGEIVSKGMNPAVALVSSDERVFKYRHPIPTSKTFERYAMIVICAEKWGLVANTTRFVHFGELSDELNKREEQLAQIFAAMIHKTRPGVKMNEVIQTAVQKYADIGEPDDWRYLHMGGLTGYNTREIVAKPTTENAVAKNQAFAWNPALQGVKMEHTFVVRDHGAEILTHTGDWPVREVTIDGQTYPCPKILVRKQF